MCGFVCVGGGKFRASVVFVYEKCTGRVFTDVIMRTEFSTLQRSLCLDFGGAIMGFSQITVITVVVLMQLSG